MTYFTAGMTTQQVRERFKELALANHPDRHPGEFAKYNRVMRELLEAYQAAMNRAAVTECSQADEAKGRPDLSQAEYIRAAEAAQLMRKLLSKHFPGHKFYVRTDTYSMGASVDIRWIDGPNENQVRDIVGAFQGRGFDAMTDSSYSYYSWLMPDGSTIHAGTRGAGFQEEWWTPKPHPKARLVYFGSSYVHTQRYTSPEVVTRVAEQVHAETGFPIPEIRRYPWSATKRTTYATATFAATGFTYNHWEEHAYDNALKAYTEYPLSPDDFDGPDGMALTDGETQPEPQEETDADGVRVEHDRDWTWIYFPAKPSDEVRQALKDQFGACWSRKRTGWYIRERVKPQTVLSAIA